MTITSGGRMKIEDLNPNPRNPRKVTDERLNILKKSLEQYGDLSGLVYNRKTKRIVSGHQRTRVLPRGTDVTINKKFDEPTDKGTVALGHVKINGELIPYREVEWDEPTETAAMIAANKPAGEWDMLVLPDLINELDSLNIDMELTGFDMKEIEEMMTPGSAREAEENKRMIDVFGAPPFSVLDARQGYWQERKDFWIGLGIKSEIGRGGEQMSSYKSQERLAQFQATKKR